MNRVEKRRSDMRKSSSEPIKDPDRVHEIGCSKLGKLPNGRPHLQFKAIPGPMVLLIGEHPGSAE